MDAIHYKVRQEDRIMSKAAYADTEIQHNPSDKKLMLNLFSTRI